MTRLCGFDPSATAAVGHDTDGKTRLRFNDGSRFTVNSDAAPDAIIDILRRARHEALADQRDPRRRRFALSDQFRAYAR